jgi:hypothetical protein
MSAWNNAPSPPLENAILEWSATVDAVNLAVYRVRSGGSTDPAALAGLLAAVEVARQRCETLAKHLGCERFGNKGDLY